MLLDYLHDEGLEVTTDGQKLIVKSHGELSGKHLSFLKLHKLDIIQELQASNDERKFRFSYQFELSDGSKGTVITDKFPEKAERELNSRFVGRNVTRLE